MCIIFNRYGITHVFARASDSRTRPLCRAIPAHCNGDEMCESVNACVGPHGTLESSDTTRTLLPSHARSQCFCCTFYLSTDSISCWMRCVVWVPHNMNDSEQAAKLKWQCDTCKGAFCAFATIHVSGAHLWLWPHTYAAFIAVVSVFVCARITAHK